MNTYGYWKKQLAWFEFNLPVEIKLNVSYALYAFIPLTCKRKTNSGLESLKAQTHQTYVKGRLLSGCLGQKVALGRRRTEEFYNTLAQTVSLYSYFYLRIGTILFSNTLGGVYMCCESIKMVYFCVITYNVVHYNCWALVKHTTVL